MTNYNQQTGQGESWQRCYEVVIDNPLNAAAQITFKEEMVVQIGENTFTKPITACRSSFDSEAEVPLLNPETGLATGPSFTHQELYQYLYSLYIHTAKQRDTPNPPLT